MEEFEAVRPIAGGTAQPLRHGIRLWVRQRFSAGWSWARLLMPKSWPTALGSAFACVAVVSLGVDSLGTPTIAAGLAILGLVPLVGDWREVRQELRDLYPIDHPVADVVVDGDWELVRCGQGRVIRSSPVDRQLDRPIVFEPRPYVLPEDLAAVKAAVIAHARSERSRAASQPFDGLNVRLCSDLDPSGGEALLQPTRYFDTMASNYLAGKQWWSTRLRRVVADVSRNIVTASGHLIPLSQSDLANQVGVSTVALTEDGWMLLVHQGPAARSSPGLVAPSGSGSLEPQDVKGRSRLADVVAAGMERELREELGLGSAPMRQIRITTEVRGFGRWLEKGAKPEFFGITRIHAPLRNLDLTIDLSERQFVNHHLRIPPTDVERLLAGTPFETLGRGLPSVPLELCLRQLREK